MIRTEQQSIKIYEIKVAEMIAKKYTPFDEN